jgi:hypothetical protein
VAQIQLEESMEEADLVQLELSHHNSEFIWNCATLRRESPQEYGLWICPTFPKEDSEEEQQEVTIRIAVHR